MGGQSSFPEACTAEHIKLAAHYDIDYFNICSREVLHVDESARYM